MPSPIVGTNARNAEVVTVRCVGAGSSNPTSVVGSGVTVTRTATGTYTVTLNSSLITKRKGTLLYGAASSKIASGNQLIGSVAWSGGSAQVVFRTAAGVDTDPPSNAVVDILFMVAGS